MKKTNLGGYVLKHLKTLPGNPRLIKDEKFMALVESLKSAPWMMKARPIIIDETATILGGNMRKKALEHLGYVEIPGEWVKPITGLTDQQKKEFIIKDNVSFGEWDYDLLANGFDEADLLEWGLDIPELDQEDVKAIKGESEPRQHFSFSTCDATCRSSKIEYHALFRNNDMDLEDLKRARCNAWPFTRPLEEHLKTYKEEDLYIVMAPAGARAEKNGFHFLMEVVDPIRKYNFISPFVNKNNRITLSPDWRGEDIPKNFIILDDIVTRGTTIKNMNRLLPGAKQIVILITNH